MTEFWLCFVPLFVAVDSIGVLPLFTGLIEGLDRRTVNTIIFESILTATLVALSFLAIGTGLFNLLGIRVEDFMIAGGCLLFVFSLTDLLTSGKTRREVDPESLGAVPLGVPLLVGPAVLTTCVLLLNEHGIMLTAAAIMVNLGLAGVFFWFAAPIMRLLGRAGSKTVSKIASLLLAAIAVMMVRRGLVAFITGQAGV